MVSRLERPSFFGLPPLAVAPKASTEVGDEPGKDSVDLRSERSAWPNFLRPLYDLGDLSDSDSASDQEMLDSPAEESSQTSQDFDVATVHEDENVWAEWTKSELPQAFAQLRGSPGSASEVSCYYDIPLMSVLIHIIF